MIKIFIPELQIETIAKDELDIKMAVIEAIISFYIISEKFGDGVKKELEYIKKEID